MFFNLTFSFKIHTLKYCLYTNCEKSVKKRRFKILKYSIMKKF